MTSFYMFRTVFMTFHGESRMDPHVAHHVHESPSIMTTPLVILAGLSIVGGFVGIPVLQGGNAIGIPGPCPKRAGDPLPAGTGTGRTTRWAWKLGSWPSPWPSPDRLVAGEEILRAAAGPAAQDRRGAGGLYRLVFNKYWVDELYDAIAVRPWCGAPTGCGPWPTKASSTG